MEATGTKSLLNMLLLIILCVSAVCGIERSCYFERITASSESPSVNHNIIHCAASCLAATSCQCFPVATEKDKCFHALQDCRFSGKEGLYYKRKWHYDGMSKQQDKTKTSGINFEKKDKAKLQLGPDRLLLMPYNSSDPAKELDLQTKTMLVFGDMSLTYIRSVTFMPKSSKLLLCMGNSTWPDIIVSTLPKPRKNAEKKVLKSRLEATALGIDEASRVIFLIRVNKRKRHFLKMGANGVSLQIISLNLEWKAPVTFVIDIMTKSIYTAYGDHVSQHTYTGIRKASIATGHRMISLSLDTENDMLYYTLATTIFQRNNRYKEKRPFAFFDSPDVNNIVFYNKSIWYNSLSSHKLCEIRNQGGIVCKWQGVEEHPLFCKIKL